MVALLAFVVACSPGDGENTAASGMVTLEWSSACVELWNGDDLIATSSVSRAHDGEWYEPRTTEYFCEMAMPALPSGAYQLCDQGRTDCKAVSVPSGSSSKRMQLLLEIEE